MRNFIYILTFILCSSSVTAQSGGRPMKFINYNVLHGFNNDSALESRFVDWAKRQDADVFAFQELNGFNEDSLEALASRYGHPYAVINTGVTHPIGLTSRYPIVMVQHVTTNMWHSYLYGNINGVHVFVTHLSPFEVKLRRRDIDRVLAHADLLPADEKIIIAGDFNALAAADSLQYGDELAAVMRKSEGRREPKSGLPIVKGKTIYRNNLDSGRIDYTVTNKMLEAGFLDAFNLKNRKFKASAPTEGHRKKSSRLKRIDYIWVNKVMAETVTGADIIQDAETSRLSDHYPVIMSAGF